MNEGIFDEILNLEENYYREGYCLGVEDGERAGRIEGRTFGLEKGFEKFFEMGRLHGKSQIWNKRLPMAYPKKAEGGEAESHELTLLPDNERLAKHIRTLDSLTDLESLSTENNEDSVSDFDDRLNRAIAKIKVIENIIGDRSSHLNQSEPHIKTRRAGIKLSRDAISNEKNIEDIGFRIR
ncbi:uncharacterized protein PV09_03660 [Verruconis gallopava]|uniref:Essential protein Yae1 N-terminal domain-containing protein n=1 Tax=Verruconis gallopava TaxID=253628 RepID=A0A0D2ADP1_9PEZI|nr:uncharacterized protein PV09_03660 [Verruconis gallopava]KIW05103.1 hypothetical protein PV09_03660 [Verruconis gallopava]